MKSILKYILIVTVLLGSVSCEDFLKEDPKGQLTSDKTFRNRDDLMGSLHALYVAVRTANNGHIQFTFTNQGDDLTTHPAMNKAVIREFDMSKVSNENSNMMNAISLWQWSWRTVKAANFIITCPDNIPGASVDDLNLVRGQAHFWRAWAYFMMVRVWGPLPIVEVVGADANIQLSKISDVYEFIVADLKKAEGLTQATYPSPSYAMVGGVNIFAGKGAVQATLAQVYLTMGGWPLNYGTDYYKMAAAEALKVINGGYYYELYDDYAKIHSNAENRKNTECVLGVYYDGGPNQTGDNGYCNRATIMDFPDFAGAWNDVSGEVKFYVNFPKGRRKDYTYSPVLVPGNSVTTATPNGVPKPWWSGEIPIANRKPFSRKSAFMSFNHAQKDREYDVYQAFSLQDPAGWTVQTKQIIRLAEVYLWYAEAVGRANLTDQNAKALELLNAVRDRANGSVDPERGVYKNLSGESLAKAAWDEHGWEIAMWWGGPLAPRVMDQKRMHKVSGYYGVQEHYESRKTEFAQQLTHPIPESGEPLLLPDGTEIWDGKTVVRAGESFGPVEPWNEEKMFSPYPKVDSDQIECFRNVDKFSLIK